MANQINEYPIQATEIEDLDYVDIDKYISLGVYDSQKILGSNLNYDSGSKLIPWHNGTYGLADTGNDGYRPNIRIVNRRATINGALLLPLQKSTGVLDGVGSGYPSEPFQELFISLLNGGWTIGNSFFAITSDPILPENLCPEINQILQNNVWVSRTVVDATNRKTRCQSFMSNLALTTNGNLTFNSVNSTELDGSTSQNSKNDAMLFRKIVSKFTDKDEVTLFTGTPTYENSFAPGGGDNAVNTSEATKFYEFTHDGNWSENLGGYIIQFNFSYDIDSSKTIAQIRSAFDSM